MSVRVMSSSSTRCQGNIAKSFRKFSEMKFLKQLLLIVLILDLEVHCDLDFGTMMILYLHTQDSDHRDHLF